MFIANRSSGSIYDRLKRRYGNDQQDWQSSFREKNGHDFEYIQYIVNFIIEQAKHNIVISELPDVIRTLHGEAETILRKNRMITLQEVITQVQRIGAMKYPYLKKVKPISTEDFVKEATREVFDRLGTIITLDMIENICRFTACSANQLLQAMPAIDVSEAATLIIEDISRNQSDNHKQTDVLKKIMPFSTSALIDKERMRSERDLVRSISPNSKQLHKDLSKMRKKSQSPQISSTHHQSSKNINKNQQSRSIDHIESTNHFAPTIPENSSVTNLMKNSKVSSSSHTKESQHMETNEKISNIKSMMKEQPKHPKSEIIHPSKSNTQTYSIHSEEGLSPPKSIKQNSSHPVPSTDLQGSKSTATMRQFIRHYSKYCYQHSDTSDNEEQITDIDNDNCPVEDILNRRLIPQI